MCIEGVKMRTALAITLGFLLAGTAAAHPNEPQKPARAEADLGASARAAAAVVDGFHAALRRGDTKGALGFLAENALIFESGGAERSKAEYASHHLGADAAFSQAVPSKVTRRAGEAIGNVAWIATEGRTAGNYKGKPIDVMTTETMVLKRSGGVWKITHIHWSSVDNGK